MTTKEAEEKIEVLKAQAEHDGDSLFICHVSKKDDNALYATVNVDFADALVIVTDIVKKYGIHIDSLAATLHQQLEADGAPNHDDVEHLNLAARARAQGPSN